MSDKENAFAIVKKAAGNRLVEPLAVYSDTDVQGVALHVAGGALPPSVKSSRPGNRVFCGSNAQAAGAKISFQGSNNVVFVGPEAKLGAASITIDGKDGLIYIGALTTAVSFTIKMGGQGGQIVIGDDCMFAARIFIGNEDGHSIYDEETGARINLPKDVLIDDHVWIGRDVHVNKGVKVGSNSIIGQGSVAAGTMQAGCIYAGVPARALREGVNWSRWTFSSTDQMVKSESYRRYQGRIDAIRRRISEVEAANAPAMPVR